ncbi:MAG: glycosyltransferase, partial [Candidatus Omnitrophota bacterium]
MQDYSVIIPALNEEADIAGCIQNLRALNSRLQIIVVDGGSSDQTFLIAEKAGAQAIRSEPGRGIQCNRGARK